ncbi:DUF3331 domain-containing protein [Paraburkholderia sp. BR10923]|uniref:DUF3331 domain-containing protein n=1 Tax=Paraburkholderia sp. BR10923 TaxID=3236992 RepID=UPI0034CE718D
MELHSNVVDPWLMTIGLLGSMSGETDADYLAAPAVTPGLNRTPGNAVRCVTIRVVERSTATRVTLAWRDPLRCAYGDQEWYLARAPRSGVCAVSGREIRRGENVYRPRPRRPQPLNADEMISMDALDHSADC